MTRVRLTALGALGAVALALIACAPAPGPVPSAQSQAPSLATPSPSSQVEPSSSRDPTGGPSPTAPSGPDLPGLLVCEGSDVEVTADILGAPANAELDIDAPALALRAFVLTPEAASLELPRSGWRRVEASPDSVTFLAHGKGGWVIATVAPADDGSWQFWEGGQCPLRIRLPDELGFATWRVDPANPPAGDEDTISVLVTELACAGGRPPLGRLLAPVVLATDDAVTIAFAARKLPGGQDCPSNPETRVLVRLAEPLADRRLFDGSTFPAEPRT